MSYTKGPWEWRDSDDLRTLADREEYRYGSQVMGLRISDDGDREINCCGEDRVLIAAAPTLLEALKLAAAYVGRGIVEGAYKNCAVSGEKALDTIESAIAKAEGKP